MDGSQNYTSHSLSHALRPPSSVQPGGAYSGAGYPPSAYQVNSAAAASASTIANGKHDGDEEEEEEEEESAASERRSPRSNGAHQQHPTAPTSAAPAQTGPDAFIHHPASSSAGHASAQGEKRRPGRPKGSKNRKSVEGGPPAIQPKYPTSSTAPAIPGMPAQNQQYWEFQWRVLNLCSEFYGAAEELIKGTPPTIIQQTYQHGPSPKVNPMEMLNEARRICDQLLANPQQLAGQPAPPPVYNPYAVTAPAPAPAPVAAATTASSSKPAAYPVAIQPAYYAAGPTAYPSYAGTAYYQYPYAYAVPHQPGTTPTKPETATPAPTQVARQPTPATPSNPPPVALQAAPAPPSSAPSGASGTWGENEIARLKQLAEQSKATTAAGDVNWDWVIEAFGPTRSRHQILLKSTSLGLKESTTRPNQKRKREGDDEPRPAPTPPVSAGPPPQAQATPVLAPAPPYAAPEPPKPASVGRPASASVSSVRPPSAHAVRPPSAHAARPASGSVSAPAPPWPMPVVASGASPVNIQVSPRQDSRVPPGPPGTFGYPQSRAQPAARVHQYMFQPSTSAGQGGGDGR